MTKMYVRMTKNAGKIVPSPSLDENWCKLKQLQWYASLVENTCYANVEVFEYTYLLKRYRIKINEKEIVGFTYKQMYIFLNAMYQASNLIMGKDTNR